ncbi:hypothetical protein [Streptomyces acidiscabies]|uniref:Uncharacterized protein n=1 Tax=Streptomyces acidiscabies TaxID=42234 RepID=A0AAP6BHH1_9ACTN|nr:hypothetical protein [Streptomyces acidiscabies]MBP5934929.1 hypothetical protein [Streptomyces sp. LBUM 1476]MBZ3917303.1 hypothetical protein [Streptomyces acidiscabies]MDX2964828.1 hypothetical protein [Streptomyces acidiscabies]MDX3023329.1 hypothetical protein [Streptomyces acidiscabies]MDX3795868.1 hypothetical protein [Streptomyces acidiscabies]
MTPEDTAALLARFEADPQTVRPERPGLDTTFPESVEALPRLAADRAPSQRHWILYAAGPIVSSARRMPEAVAASEDHTFTLAELSRLTTRWTSPSTSASSRCT